MNINNILPRYITRIIKRNFITQDMFNDLSNMQEIKTIKNHGISKKYDNYIWCTCYLYNGRTFPIYVLSIKNYRHKDVIPCQQ